MSKVIKKKDLDLMIENTLKENGLLKEDIGPATGELQGLSNRYDELNKQREEIRNRLKSMNKGDEGYDELKQQHSKVYEELKTIDKKVKQLGFEGQDDGKVAHNEEEDDLVGESTRKLAESASDSSNVNLLKEDMASFKRLINHRI